MENKKVLFQVKLQYDPDKEPVRVSIGSQRTGELLGSGAGTVKGEHVQGKVHWSLFEIQGVVCETNIIGVITTTNGTRIEFETKGYGLVPDKTQPNKWHMPAVVRFKVDSPDYDWLNSTLATWEGDFDMSTGTHTYQAYY